MSDFKKRVKQPILVTPQGTAFFPHLLVGDGKFNKDTPKKHTKLLFDPNDVLFLEFKAKVDAAVDVMIAEYKAENPKFAKKLTVKYPIFRDSVDDQGEETGTVEIKAACRTSYVDKKTEKVVPLNLDIRDSKGTIIKPTMLWGGSILRLAVRPGLQGTGAEVTPYLQLQGVQVIKLVAGGNSTNHFDAVDGGYEGSGADDADEDSEEETAGGESEDGAEDDEFC